MKFTVYEMKLIVNALKLAAEEAERKNLACGVFKQLSVKVNTKIKSAENRGSTYVKIINGNDVSKIAFDL